MSRRTIRPPGPDPRTWPSSTCDAAATLRASGLALSRPPPAAASSAAGACWPLPAEWLGAAAAGGGGPLRPALRPCSRPPPEPWPRPSDSTIFLGSSPFLARTITR